MEQNKIVTIYNIKPTEEAKNAIKNVFSKEISVIFHSYLVIKLRDPRLFTRINPNSNPQRFIAAIGIEGDNSWVFFEDPHITTSTLGLNPFDMTYSGNFEYCTIISNSEYEYNKVQEAAKSIGAYTADTNNIFSRCHICSHPQCARPFTTEEALKQHKEICNHTKSIHIDVFSESKTLNFDAVVQAFLPFNPLNFTIYKGDTKHIWVYFNSYDESNHAMTMMNKKMIGGVIVNAEAPLTEYTVCIPGLTAETKAKDVEYALKGRDINYILVNFKKNFCFVSLEKKEDYEALLGTRIRINGKTLTVNEKRKDFPPRPITPPKLSSPPQTTTPLAIQQSSQPSPFEPLPNKVKLGKLPAFVTKDLVTKFYKGQGIKTTRVYLKKDMSECYVSFENYSDLQKALKLNNFYNNTITVKIDNFKKEKFKAFVKGYPPGTTEEDLKRVFSHLEIVRTSFSKKDGGKYCFIYFKDQLNFQQALSFNGKGSLIVEEYDPQKKHSLKSSSAKSSPTHPSSPVITSSSSSSSSTPKSVFHNDKRWKMNPVGLSSELTDSLFNFGSGPIRVSLDDAIEEAGFSRPKEMMKTCNEIVSRVKRECGVPLSDDDIRSILMYTYELEDEDFKSPYEIVNTKLSKRSTEGLRFVRNYVLFLLRALRKLPRYDYTRNVLYRGIDGSKVADDKYQKGKEIVWNGFTSASTSESVARDFMEGSESPILFVIRGNYVGYDIEKITFRDIEKGKH